MSALHSGLFLEPFDPDWKEFIAASPETCIFHHPSWQKLLAECYGYRPFVLAVRKEDGRICAGVPFMEIQSPITGKRWAALPFSDHCQPLYENNAALTQLAEYIVSLAKCGEIPRVDLRGVYPPHLAIQAYSEHVLHEIALEANASKVLSRMHPMHRRNIKTAEANGIQVIWGDTQQHLHEFYHLHLQTRRRQGVPIQPWSFFQNLGRIILDPGLGFVLLAYKDRLCLAGAIFLHWQATLTYKYGASSVDGLKFRPNNLIMWTAMQWGCEHGFTKLDLGRSSLLNTGLRTYKDRWGGREVSLLYAQIPSRPDIPNHGMMEKWMRIVLQKTPSWVCRLAGELLYKHFG